MGIPFSSCLCFPVRTRRCIGSAAVIPGIAEIVGIIAARIPVLFDIDMRRIGETGGIARARAAARRFLLRRQFRIVPGVRGLLRISLLLAFLAVTGLHLDFLMIVPKRSAESGMHAGFLPIRARTHSNQQLKCADCGVRAWQLDIEDQKGLLFKTNHEQIWRAEIDGRQVYL